MNHVDTVKCYGCGKDFEPWPDAWFCSPGCRKAYPVWKWPRSKYYLRDLYRPSRWEWLRKLVIELGQWRYYGKDKIRWWLQDHLKRKDRERKS